MIYVALKKTPQNLLHLHLKQGGNAYQDTQKLSLQSGVCRTALWQPHPFASQQKQCYRLVRDWFCLLGVCKYNRLLLARDKRKDVQVLWRGLPPSKVHAAPVPSQVPWTGGSAQHGTGALNVGLRLWWSSKRALNNTGSSQPAERASRCPMGCSSPSCVPPTLGQASVGWRGPRVATHLKQGAPLLLWPWHPWGLHCYLPPTTNPLVCWKRHMDKQSKLLIQ